MKRKTINKILGEIENSIKEADNCFEEDDVTFDVKRSNNYYFEAIAKSLFLITNINLLKKEEE